MENVDVIEWSQEDMLEVTLSEPDDFLKVKETLTRIGVASNKDKTMYQSCHILHKKGRYFIMHFKELFLLDGRTSNLTKNDLERRNTIATLLCDWGLIEIVKPDQSEDRAPLKQIKIISHKQKSEWNLVPKYTVGKG